MKHDAFWQKSGHTEEAVYIPEIETKSLFLWAIQWTNVYRRFNAID